MRRFVVFVCAVLGGGPSVAWAATIPEDVGKWASQNPASLNTISGCGKNHGTPYCETQEGVDRLVALYNAGAKGQKSPPAQ
jgi:hypothetical protein